MVLRAQTWNEACGRCFEALGDGRTPAQFRHGLQDGRFSFDALLDKGKTQRNKGTSGSLL